MDWKNRLAFVAAISLCSSAGATDHGFAGVNTLGRYLGWGWSKHTYHSQVDGRLNVITNRHQANQYGSGQLQYPYSPGYSNYPARPTFVQPLTPWQQNLPIADESQLRYKGNEERESENSSTESTPSATEQKQGNAGPPKKPLPPEKPTDGSKTRAEQIPTPKPKLETDIDDSTSPSDRSKSIQPSRPTSPKLDEAPTKPSGPIPKWLKPYLDDGKTPAEAGSVIELKPSVDNKVSNTSSPNRYR
jgi:hypothetical protein